MPRTITTTRQTTWDASSSGTFTDTFTLSNLGPLTTTFTPPSECLNTWYMTNVHLELGVTSRSDCFPPGFTPGNYWTSGYYSPGLCPSSYTAAKSLDLWWTAAGESGFHCCPIGYLLPAALTGSCFHPLSSTITSTYTDGTFVGLALLSEIWAPAIPVLWKDLGEFTRAPMTTQSATNPASPTTAPAPGGSVSPASPPESGAATSLNGKPIPSRSNHTRTIAIATAVPIVVVIVIAIIALLLLRRRARQNAATATTDTTNYIPELEGNVDDVHKPGARVWPTPIELPTIPAPIELPTSPTRPVELPAVHPSAASTPPVVTPEIPVIASVDSTTVTDQPLETLEVPVNAESTTSPLTVPARKVVPVVAPQEDQEIAWLNSELERVNERRENLRKLEALNDEHRELERRINERMGGGRADM